MLSKLLSLLKGEKPIFNFTLMREQGQNALGSYYVADSGRILPGHKSGLKTYKAEINIVGDKISHVHWPNNNPGGIFCLKNTYKVATTDSLRSGEFFLYETFIDSKIKRLRHKPEKVFT